MKKTIEIVVILISAFLFGCDFQDSKLTVQNNTKEDMLFIIPTEPNYFPTCADTSFSEEDKHNNDSLFDTKVLYDISIERHGGIHFVPANSSIPVSTFNTTWEGIIESSREKKLKVLFFSPFEVPSGKYTWKELYATKIKNTQEFSKNELKKKNWQITYQ